MLLRAIGTGSVDIPFASIYSVEYSQSTTRLKLVDTVGGIEKGTPYTPLSLSTDIDITKYSNKEKDFLLALLRVVKTGKISRPGNFADNYFKELPKPLI